MPTTYSCTTCNEEFDLKSERDNHFRQYCQSFVKLIEIDGNIKRIERVNGKFDCFNCGKQYNRSDNLMAHWKKCQTKEGTQST